MRFDPEKQHRRSLRIKNRDYSRDGYYFVTICARNRENLFADLDVGAELAPAPVPTPTLRLTTIGQIIEKNWRKIADQNVKTDAFVIMPNHIHGIIIIKPHALCVGAGLAPAPDSRSDNDHGRPRGAPLQQKNTSPSTLGSIIGAFKSRCAMDYLRFVDENCLNESAKIWQRNYYEHIIRDNKELAAIRKYIRSNPSNWAKDKENPLNL